MATTSITSTTSYSVQRPMCCMSPAEHAFIHDLDNLWPAMIDDQALSIFAHGDPVLSCIPRFDVEKIVLERICPDGAEGRRQTASQLMKFLTVPLHLAPEHSATCRDTHQQISRHNLPVDDAVRRVVQFEKVQTYLHSLSRDQQELFRELLRQYLASLLPQCPWSVDATHRLNPLHPLVSLRARTPLAKHAVVEGLTGIRRTARGDAVGTLGSPHGAVGSRCGEVYYIVGPLRMVARSCQPNLELLVDAHGRVSAIATVDVAVGQELTVAVERDLFGTRNARCLCAFCQSQRLGAWQLEGTAKATASPSRDLLQALLHARLCAVGFVLPNHVFVPRRVGDETLTGQAETVLDYFAICSTCRAWFRVRGALASTMCLPCQRHSFLFGCYWPAIPVLQVPPWPANTTDVTAIKRPLEAPRGRMAKRARYRCSVPGAPRDGGSLGHVVTDANSSLQWTSINQPLAPPTRGSDSTHSVTSCSSDLCTCDVAPDSAEGVSTASLGAESV